MVALQSAVAQVGTELQLLRTTLKADAQVQVVAVQTAVGQLRTAVATAVADPTQANLDAAATAGTRHAVHPEPRNHRDVGLLTARPSVRGGAARWHHLRRACGKPDGTEPGAGRRGTCRAGTSPGGGGTAAGRAPDDPGAPRADRAPAPAMVATDRRHAPDSRELPAGAPVSGRGVGRAAR